jgi:hypothetical protein
LVLAANIADKRDEGSKTSKINAFEVEMVLSCVRYLGQQGYGTDKLVVLTPYLGQLRLLVEELSKSTDPVLNDLDSYDLIRAGLLPAAAANGKKSTIKISTVGEKTHLPSPPDSKTDYHLPSYYPVTSLCCSSFH